MRVSPETAEGDGPRNHSWRADLIQRSGWIMLLLGTPMAVYLSTFPLTQPRPIKIASMWLIPLAGACAALARRVDFRVRGSGLVVTLLLVGGVVVRFIGVTPGMVLCFVLGTVLATLLFGTRAGLVALAVSVGAFLILGWAGRKETSSIRIEDLALLENWFRMAVVYSLLAGLLVFLVAGAMSRVEGAEQALRASEERWRRISEATFEGIAFSQDGILIDVNRQLAEMLGYLPEELIGKPVVECVAPEDRDKVSMAIRSGHTGGSEHRAQRKDGYTFPVETRARAMSYRGRPLRVTAVRDVSERTRLEAELRQRETLAAVGSLVVGVAHEVRNPLFSLSAALDALEAGSSAPGEDDELKGLLRSQVLRLSNLMQDLLDYGRPPRLRLARGGLHEPVRRAARSCERLASEAGVSLGLEIPGGLPELDLDPGRMEQVFENLIANAVQHSPRAATVRVAARPVEGPLRGVSLTVADEGPGVAPDDLGRVFEPFFSRRQGGTGLGLPIAHRLVEAHGGTLSAANRREGGAVFTVFLPGQPSNVGQAKA